MEITSKQIDLLIDRLYDVSNLNTEFETRLDYSGRYMHGKSCVGFVTDNPTKLHGAICAVLAEDETTAFDNDWPRDLEGISWYDLNPQVDSMGLSSILYYPNFSVSE